MTEYFTEALVIERSEANELDESIVLYTENLGKVIAKAKSIRKISSKLSGHLQPLNFVLVRLIEKNGFQVVDALTIDRRKDLRRQPTVLERFLRILQFIQEMTFELQPDNQFYLAIKKIMNSKIDEKDIYRTILKVLGFDPEFAACSVCRRKEAKFFLKEEQIFFCRQCALPRHLSSIAKPKDFSDLIEI